MSDQFHFEALGEDDTERVGAAVAKALEPGVVVALIGNLGAGKTRLVQAVAAALGINRDDVSSPTFVLLQEHSGRLPLFHFDAYRLRDTDEFLELGAAELLESNGACFIEWADRVAEALPSDVLRIAIEPTGPTARGFSLSGSGPRSLRLLQRIAQSLGPHGSPPSAGP